MNIKTNEIIEIIRSTRALSLPNFGNIEVKEYKSQSATDAVTEIDQKIEAYLKFELSKILPDVAFVGEEFGGDRKSQTFWLVDPIDGTGNYIRGIPFCTTMLALIHDDKVIFSAIYDFVNDDMYHAELGKGSFKNTEKICVSSRSTKQAYLSFEVKSQKEENKALLSEVRNRANLLNLLCSGYEFILVASGRIEARIVYDGFGKDYDFAAGTLLVSEAGGIVKNFGSDTYNYKDLNFIASNKELYTDLFDPENSIEKFIG